MKTFSIEPPVSCIRSREAVMNRELVSSKLKFAAVVGAAVIVGDLLIVALWRFAKRLLKPSPPKKWRQVGKVSDLLCYPIKSCGWIQINDIDCKNLGLEKNNLRDRIFMVVNSETGEFVTGRKYPKLVLVKPEIQSNVMTLSAPGMPSVDINFTEMMRQKPSKAVVWDESVKVIDAGDAAASFFSRFILDKYSGLRLVYYPSSRPSRDVRKKNKIFETTIREDTGALHDATSYMLINESSVTDLNRRLENSVTSLQFRGNFIINTPVAYEEDTWKWVKIGEEAIFENVKPCTRCVFTNVHPTTAEVDAAQEPLKTLKSYRKFEKTGESPTMGIHLGLRREGNIKLHDAVYVEDE